MPHFPHGQRSLQMLGGNLSCGATEERVAGQYHPERHAKRVEVRTYVNGCSRELLRAGEFRCSSKGPRGRNRGLSTRLIERLGQAQVDDFRSHSACFLQANHDIAGLDVAMNQLLLVYCGETGRDLRCNFQRQLHFDLTRASDEMLKGLSLDKLHRIKVTAPASAQVE